MKDQLQGMRVFAQVVDSKSFSSAAQKLGISKSLASRHVTALERAYSTKLLHRSTRKLSLTEAGAVLYEHCARIVQEAELAEQRVTRVQSEPAGLVRLTVAPAFATRHVVPALADFHAQHPKIRIMLSCSNRTLELGEAGTDLGIRISSKPDSHLVARKLAANRAVLCASPGYLERHGMPRRLQDLGRHACVRFPPTAPKGAWTLTRAGKKQTVRIDGPLETDDMDAVRAAIVAGIGIGILPAYMAGDALERGELVQVLGTHRVASDSAIYLVYLPNRTLPSRVRAVIDYLVGRFSPVPPWEVGW
jgi:DNA-binding transcriptional LysR family regulator